MDTALIPSLFGFGIIVQSAVFGLGSVINSWPWLLSAVKIGGASWLIYMAVRFRRTAIFRVTGEPESRTRPISRPFRFLEVVLFQRVNPKAIIIALSAAAALVSICDKIYQRALLIGGVYLLVGWRREQFPDVAGRSLEPIHDLRVRCSLHQCGNGRAAAHDRDLGADFVDGCLPIRRIGGLVA